MRLVSETFCGMVLSTDPPPAAMPMIRSQRATPRITPMDQLNFRADSSVIRSWTPATLKIAHEHLISLLAKGYKTVLHWFQWRSQSRDPKRGCIRASVFLFRCIPSGFFSEGTEKLWDELYRQKNCCTSRIFLGSTEIVWKTFENAMCLVVKMQNKDEKLKKFPPLGVNAPKMF